MKRLLALVSLLLAAQISIHAQTEVEDIQRYISQSPFPMTAPVLPQFADKTFNIKDSGAVADGKTLNTAAFDKTIAACNEAGGGTVLVPAGTWLTGPIKLRSNVNLHLEKGALVQFTSDHTQYPMIKAGSKSSTITPASPVYGYDLKNIAITGEGILDGAGDSWRPVKKGKRTTAEWDALVASGGVLSADGKIWWPSREAMDGEQFTKDFKASGKKATPENYLQARDFLRPYMLFLVNCQNILIEGVTIRNSPKFVFYPSRSTNLTMKHVTVFNEWYAQNGDGIDISACKNVLIYKCNVSCGDDAICMKSSQSSSDVAGGFNLENILIAGCTVQRGHGGFVIGSNTDGGMRNIFVTDCNFDGTDIGLRVKSNTGRGGVVKDIYVRDITMSNIIHEAILFDTYYEDMPAGKTKGDDTIRVEDEVPEFHDFHISNVTCEGAGEAISIRGLPQMPVHNIYFDSVTISSKAGMSATDAAQLFFNDIKITPEAGPVFSVTNVSGLTIKKGYCPPESKVFLAAGGTTQDITIESTTISKPDKAIKLEKSVDAKTVIIQ